jgi:glycogen/starch synthases, ADP-glucose type
MKVLSVVSEFYPLIKTGGLADVAGSLPKALRPFGIETFTLLPAYPPLRHLLETGHKVASFQHLLGHKAEIYRNGNILLLHIPRLFDREGSPYRDCHGMDFGDNWLRFAVLSLAGAELASDGTVIDVDLVHVHDWQAALLPVYLRYRFASAMPVLLTIHNLAFQGQFDWSIMPHLGLPETAFGYDCLEYYGGIGFLKGGIQCSNAISTVSPTYAREILSTDHGMGLDGLLHQRRSVLHGIVNGVDVDTWSPDADPLLVKSYNHRSLGRRDANRAALLRHFGLEDLGGPVFAVLSRLTWQKGSDLLPEVVDEIFSHGGQLVVRGQGDREIEAALTARAARDSRQMAVHIGYDEPSAHLILGGADILMQPSRFEPCGLTQLYAMRYGAVPLVARTGGLSETIIDANDAARDVATGFQFHPIDPHNLRLAIARACHAYKRKATWRSLQKEAMKTNFSWDRSARRYAELYRSLCAGQQTRRTASGR